MNVIYSVLGRIQSKGICVAARECAGSFPDETDRAFYEVAVSCKAYLITGNNKHYPEEPFIMSPAQFLALLDEN